MRFNPKDVIIVAKALIEDAVMYQGGDYNDGYECEYCFGEQCDDPDYFKHESGCPVLVALDLLTGVE